MYDATCKVSDAASASETSQSTGRQVYGLIRQGLDTLAIWYERALQRQHLAQLDDRMLKDIGLTRLDVARETSKAFWEK
jgi:uncharacterized protein YjiS (DUF1127 family)